MNRFVKLTVGICVVSGIVAAQRGGVMAAGGMGMAPGAPHPSHPSAGFIAPSQSHREAARGWNQPFPGAYYPGFGGLYAAEPWPVQSSPSVVILLMQPAAQTAPAPPPPPAEPLRSASREYSWPPSSARDAPTFAIVLKDKTVRRALAVCRHDSVLTYVEPNGAGAEIAVSTVDPDATRRANTKDLLQ